MRILTMLMALVTSLAAFAQNDALAQYDPKPEVAFYVSDGVVQEGCVYKPPGQGPFPAMIFNQATPKPCISMGDPQPFYPLAKYYTTRGFVLFLPGRPLLQEPTGKASSVVAENVKFMESMERHNKNITAAVGWLKAQSYVDPKRMVMSGHSTGGIQALLLAESDLDMRAFVSFSPAAKTLGGNPLLQDALTKAARNAKAPVFLIQPQNDFALKPMELLAPILLEQGKQHRTKIFDIPGTTQTEANSFAFNMPNVWGADVFAFINTVMRL